MADPDDNAVQRSSILIDQYSRSKEELGEKDAAYDNLRKLAPTMYVIIYFLVNIFVWMAFEPEWNYAESIYFICASLTTVGYGDRVPSGDWGRLYCVLFLLLSITTVFPIVSDAMDWALTRLELLAIGGDTTRDNTKRQHRKILFSAAIIFLVVIIGTAYMAMTQHWTFIEALYWSFVTSLTVGYGDQSWQYTGGTLMFISCYMMLSTMTIAVAIQNFVEVSADARNKRERETAARQIDVVRLLLDHLDGGLDGNIDEDVLSESDGSKRLSVAHITKQEFVLYMLKTTKVVSDSEVQHWEEKFGDLDTSGNGVLDLADVKKKDEKRRMVLSHEEAAQKAERGPPFFRSVRPHPAESA